MYSLAHEGITLDGASKSCLDRQVRVRVRGEGSDQPQAPSLVEREREREKEREREREACFVGSTSEIAAPLSFWAAMDA